MINRIEKIIIFQEKKINMIIYVEDSDTLHLILRNVA